MSTSRSGTPQVRVEQAGVATLQDLGRPGHGHQGIPVGGASDRWSAQVANTLVGNAPGTPLIEVTGSALVLTPGADVLLSVTGATTRWDPFVAPAGVPLVVAAPSGGLRTYVAIAGGLTGPSVLGSVAPDRTLGAGTHLTRGDHLDLATSLGSWQHPHVALFRLGAERPSRSGPTSVEVTAGPEIEEFDPAQLAGPWIVSTQSDSVGLRAEGPTPVRSTAAEILSRGVPVGAVEVPPNGGLLILLHGRLITAGYPVPYVATSAALDRLGQARPGDELVLREVPLADAVAEGHARRLALRDLARRTSVALRSSGLGALVAPGHLSNG